MAIYFDEAFSRPIIERQQEMAARDVPISVSQPIATIENFVCTGDLFLGREGEQIDLAMVAKFLRSYGAEYNEDRFAAVILRNGKAPRSPRGTILLFGSLKFVVTGTKSPWGALLCMRRLARVFQKTLGYKQCRINTFVIQNIVGCTRLNFELDLSYLWLGVLPGASYEPESFPGVIYKKGRIVFLIFFMAKIVITGGTTEEDITDGAKFIAQKCWEARLTAGSTENRQKMLASVVRNEGMIRDAMLRSATVTPVASSSRIALSASASSLTAIGSSSSVTHVPIRRSGSYIQSRDSSTVHRLYSFEADRLTHSEPQSPVLKRSRQPSEERDNNIQKMLEHWHKQASQSELFSKLNIQSDSSDESGDNSSSPQSSDSNGGTKKLKKAPKHAGAVFQDMPEL